MSVWTRRTPASRLLHPSIVNFQMPNSSSHYYSGYGVGGGTNLMNQVVTDNGSVVYLTSPDQIRMVRGREGGGGGVGERIPVVFDSVLVVQGKKVVAAAAKRLRLFGVNMDCPISSDTSTFADEFEILASSSAITPVNSPTAHLNQYPSSSTLFLPSLTRLYNSTPVSNKGKTFHVIGFGYLNVPVRLIPVNRLRRQYEWRPSTELLMLKQSASAACWGEVGAEYVVESTGVFTDKDKAAAHLKI